MGKTFTANKEVFTIKEGDFVSRKSHNHDIIFKIIAIQQSGRVDLKGLTLRLQADAPLDDLMKVNPFEAENLCLARKRLMSSRKNCQAMVTRAVNKWWQINIK
ncbi:MAG TPA: sporulation peptidase YabG [Desulfobacteria bacterium]|nr:sporulation peptidase YabG [Desulfobacteria bacterium]